MKTTLIAILLLVATMVDAQIRSYVTAARGITSHKTYSSWVHDSTGGQVDTMQAVNVDQYIETYYTIRCVDSVSIIVAYRPSYDGVTFSAPVTIDSLSNNDNAGTSKSIALPSGALGLRAVQFVRTVQAFRLGKTAPTLYEKILQKR